jgi:carboxymethylenebutenolidase
MWNSFKTDGAVGVHAEITTFTAGNGDVIHAYVAHPTSGPATRPGIVLVHHLPGWDEFYQEFAERLARHGYDVICPDLYCRFGHGTPEDVAAKVRAEGGVTDASVIADGAAALAWLKALPTSNGKVGIIGTCSGGRHSLLVASRVPGFDAIIDCWGGNVIQSAEQLSEAQPVAPIDYTADLTTPILGLFGNDDKFPTPEQVDTHEATLKEHGKEYEFHRYDGAGHGFFYYQTPMYRPESAMDAWSKIFTFFSDKLGA